MYDIFYVSATKVDSSEFKEIKKRFPNIQLVENCQSISSVSSKSFTKMFWVIWDDLILLDNFHLEDYRATKWDEQYVHVFLNGEHRDGICLFPKQLSISKREYDKRYFVEKKEVDIQASIPKKQNYDIVFISYNEPNADLNYQKLCERFSNVKRIHGVTGIHQAHIAAAKLVQTDMFYVVDGDAVIVDDFHFDYVVPKYEKFHVHVWRSKNPFNDLIYGYGGVKLLPTEKTINMDVNTTDMTTSISNNFKVVNKISNVTCFNTDAFNTWKSCFRECVKLSSQSIARQESKESLERLEAWCTMNENVPFGYYAYLGALQGKEYGEKNQNNIEAIKKINDFNWLKEKFDAGQK